MVPLHLGSPSVDAIQTKTISNLSTINYLLTLTLTLTLILNLTSSCLSTYSLVIVGEHLQMEHPDYQIKCDNDLILKKVLIWTFNTSLALHLSLFLPLFVSLTLHLSLDLIKSRNLPPLLPHLNISPSVRSLEYEYMCLEVHPSLYKPGRRQLI